jgi:hypothetical protein
MESLSSKYISISRAAYEIGISNQTIKRWYKWWESPDIEKPTDLYLPPYFYKDKCLTKYFLISDIQCLKDFHNKLQSTHKGAMSEFNAAYQWGRRGHRALENKGTTREEYQKKVR